MRGSVPAAAAIALLSLSLAACGKDEPSTPPVASPRAMGTKLVTIQGMKFDPETVTVKVGETVQWLNKDAMKHSATRDAADPKFDTDLLAPSAASTPVLFDKESDGKGWEYHCKVPGHEKMKGFVIVTK